MKNKIHITAGTALAVLCFLTVFFCLTAEAYAETGQLTHRHIGSRENGGGCYGTQRSEKWDCRSYNVNVGFNGTDYIYVCGQCGSRWSSPGKVDQPRCSGQGTTVYYEVNCGKNGAAAVSFSCEKSSQEWVKELDLTASYSVHEGGISVSGFLWNGSPGGSSLHVTQNGVYTLGLTGSGNVDFSPQISVTVDHIDHTAPAIGSFQMASDAWGPSAELQVSASDSESGLAAEAYSFDGGASWSSAHTYTVTENGTYSVRVRDAVGNVSTAETSVHNIDRTPPTVSVSASPSVDDWYDGSLTVTVHAQDAESGLSDTPYSFDGGETYLVGNSVTLSGSGTIEMAVRDRAGNVTHMSFHADKKQRPQPTPAPGGGNGASSGSGSTGSGNTGSGSTGNGSGTGSTGSGTGDGSGGSSGTGEVGANAAGAGGTENNGTGSNETGGAGGAGSGAGTGIGTAGTGSAGGGTGSGSTGGGNGAGVSGISGGRGSTGGGNQNTQGNQITGGDGKISGPINGKDNGSGRYGADNARNGSAQSESAGTLPQHYPGGLPRVGSMMSGRQNERGNAAMGEADVAGRVCEDNGAYGIGTGGVREGGNAYEVGNGDGDESSSAYGIGDDDTNEVGDGGMEDAIIQKELLASANEQEAAVLQKSGGDAWAAARDGAPAIGVCAAAFAAAVLCGWALLFGIRVDTRDEQGHYRFAGMTRVTTNGQERLRVVPLTKQIVRNSRTNELRIRFGLLCHKRYEGETLVLRYRSMRREFKAERTVELHIRA